MNAGVLSFLSVNMDQMEDPKMEDAGCSRSKEEHAMRVYYSSHRHKSESSGWMSKYTSSRFETSVGSLHDEPTSSQAE